MENVNIQKHRFVETAMSGDGEGCVDKDMIDRRTSRMKIVTMTLGFKAGEATANTCWLKGRGEKTKRNVWLKDNVVMGRCLPNENRIDVWKMLL